MCIYALLKETSEIISELRGFLEELDELTRWELCEILKKGSPRVCTKVVGLLSFPQGVHKGGGGNGESLLCLESNTKKVPTGQNHRVLQGKICN